MDVNKRLRVTTGVTPVPDLKRSRPLEDAPSDSCKGPVPTNSSGREMALKGLPQEQLTPSRGAKTGPPDAPTKLPSPEKMTVPRPRNLMPLLEETVFRHG